MLWESTTHVHPHHSDTGIRLPIPIGVTPALKIDYLYPSASHRNWDVTTSCSTHSTLNWNSTTHTHSHPSIYWKHTMEPNFDHPNHWNTTFGWLHMPINVTLPTTGWCQSCVDITQKWVPNPPNLSLVVTNPNPYPYPYPYLTPYLIPTL